MCALARILASPKPKRETRDIEQPVYPRRVAVQITGVDVKVLKRRRSPAVSARSALPAPSTLAGSPRMPVPVRPA